MPPTRSNPRTANKGKKIAASTVKLLDLNDHCLLEVFRYLKTIDMCAVKDTCQRFRGLAEKHMQIILKSEELVVGRRGENNRQVFYKFCGVLKKLTVAVEGMQSHLEIRSIYSTIRKCNPMLSSLTVCDRDFHLALSLPLLRSLQKVKLEIFDSPNDVTKRDETIKDLLKSCRIIEELSVGANGVNYFQCLFLQNTFKKLRSLELYELRNIDVNNLKIFFKLNPSVVKLKLTSCVWPRDLNNFNFVECAPNIEGISIKFNIVVTAVGNMNFYFANEFVELKKLKYLALDTRGVDVNNFLTIMTKLNSLSFLSVNYLNYLVNDGFIDAFANMHNLKVLRLHFMYYRLQLMDYGLHVTDYQPHFLDYRLPEDMFKKLCKNLVKLEEFCLANCEIFVQQIKDIVKTAVNLKKLYLPPIHSFEWSEKLYLELVELQCRKKVDWPLTIYLEDNFSFETFESFQSFIRSIPSRVSPMNSNTVRFAKCDIYDYYALPV